MRISSLVCRAAILCAVLLSAGCGSESPTAPPPSVSLNVSATPANPSPGSALRLSVDAQPSGSDRITWLGLRFGGVLTGTDSVQVDETALSVEIVIDLPLVFGTATFTTFVRTRLGAYAERSVTVALADRAPPTVGAALTRAPGSDVLPGDTLRFTVTATDDVGLDYLAVRAQGAFVAVDSQAVPAHLKSFSRGVQFVVPPGTFGQTVTLIAETRDVVGNVSRLIFGNYPVRDLTPPQLTATFLGDGSGIFFDTDTIQFRLDAADGGGLAMVGYAIDAPFSVRDSAAVTGTRYSRVVSIPADGRVGSAAVTVFGRDSLGNRTERVAARVNVLADTPAPTRTLTLANAAPVTDVAYDARRGRLYLAQPAANRVSVVDVAAAAEAAALTVGGAPSGLDVTTGGDSLLVATRDVQAIAVLNLATGERTSFTADATRGALTIRVLANSHAIVGLTFPGSGFGGGAVDVDLRTGARSTPLLATERTPLVRSADRRVLLGLIDDSCCPEQGFVYSAATGAFSPTRPVASRYFPQLAVASDGSRMYVDGMAYSPNLEPLGTFPLPPGVTSLAGAADPLEVYVGAPEAIYRVRTTDGTVLRRIRLPGQTPSKLFLLDDGVTLGALAGSRITLIDLR